MKLVLRGYSKLFPSQDTRVPITLPVLERLIAACDHISAVYYNQTLEQGMYTLAFFPALRVGEVTTRPGQPTSNLIGIDQLLFLKPWPNGLASSRR